MAKSKAPPSHESDRALLLETIRVLWAELSDRERVEWLSRFVGTLRPPEQEELLAWYEGRFGEGR